MRIRVLVVGGDKKDPLQHVAADYLARAGRRFDAGLVEIKKGRDEGAALLKASEGHARVALDPRGAVLSSEQFAAKLEKLLAAGKPVAFLIGGAEGHTDDVRAQADHLWSLSPMTFAHRLALVVVAEQIYRAAEIARGGPYHK